MVNSTFVTDAEVSSLVNEGIAGLYNLLIETRGQEYYAKDFVFSTVINQTLYDLPDDFYQLLDVTAIINNNNVYKLLRYQMADMAILRAAGASSPAELPKYRLRGDFNGTTNVAQMSILPIPTQVYAIALYYVPAPISLALDTDTCDGISGFEEWVVLDAAIRCLQKEESDVTWLIGEREKIEGRIRSQRDNRDAGDAPRVQNVRDRALQYGVGWERGWNT